MIKLYTFPLSTNSRKVRIALLEKGLEFERINVDLSKREQKQPEYLKIHPFGQVPALDDEGFIVYDSTIINEYLEDEYPYPPLMPKDSEGRARARMMEDFRDTHFNPPCVKIIYEMRKPEGERVADVIATAKADINKCFDRIEGALQGKEYLAGSFSLADIAFMANFDLLDRFQIAVDPKYANTIAWIARLKARPSFAASAS
ncbi:MAG: glutathione S-transferase family protein [Deltaproteobacteria bacterium]|nr:glutathione S-transferase family protein [Deltaproteobacteria bacterium]MBI2179312.1 glutathione S-transferase family protein [Deltaproteobacteria bacterium]MBI2228271.1 glutathione S-transferase family protein [Deltaproteobacteria bacterium]MBI2367282.1 glutathione S-transferase family protein [Deltaproteobacteria bacterium]MBI2530857.1 glutathione S-transferase family protein [Deltaproteobacteria bacterium]